MKIALNFPMLETGGEKSTETRPAKVGPWLDGIGKRDVVTAARHMGNALAATNRLALGDSRRMELATLYWKAAGALWSPLSKRYAKSTQPLTGDAQEAARVAIELAIELSNAWKRLLGRESEKRIALGGQRLLAALVRRSLQSSGRVLINCYAAYSPVPQFTWHDLHAIYGYGRERDVHQTSLGSEAAEGTPERTPELMYVQSLLLALSNPYGCMPGQIESVLRYVQEYGHLAKLTDVVPIHRLAKAVAIVPTGHDFPPFSANKGGSVQGSKMFLLTYDLAFQLQDQLAKLEGGADLPASISRDVTLRPRQLALLRRLLRQWAIPPVRQFGRLASRGRVKLWAGLFGVWQGSRQAAGTTAAPGVDLPHPATCQILNQTPGGYALRQVGAATTPLRIGDLVNLEIEGRRGTQAGIVRWFRNSPAIMGLEFGCELLSDAPEAATAALAEGSASTPTPVMILPGEPTSRHAEPDQLIAPAGTFGVEQAVRVWRAGGILVAVLVKLVDMGPDFEIFEYVAVD